MEERQRKKKEHGPPIVLVGIAVILVVIIIAALFMLQGSTTITNSNKSETRNNSLSCSGDGVDFDKIKVPDGIPRHLDIRMIFREDKLDTISLMYKLYYNTREDMEKAVAMYRAGLNDAYAVAGYNAGTFNTNYNQDIDKLTITQYAAGQKIEDNIAQFFMINLGEDGKIENMTMKDFESNYREKGLACKKEQ